MKKIVLSAVVVLLFAAYIWHQRTDKEDVNVVAPKSVEAPPAQSTPVPTDSASNLVPTSQPQPSGFRDGQYTSSVGDAFYGPLQVKLTISGGKITDVVFLQYPNDRPTSIEINSQAITFLKQEAIQSQKSPVDVVTGATQTSDAFNLLLKEVLSKAG
jgi:uncharacterized protein with FMN-binding domain